jgi:hypothetical protein
MVRGWSVPNDAAPPSCVFFVALGGDDPENARGIPGLELEIQTGSMEPQALVSNVVDLGRGSYEVRVEHAQALDSVLVVRFSTESVSDTIAYTLEGP